MYTFPDIAYYQRRLIVRSRRSTPGIPHFWNRSRVSSRRQNHINPSKKKTAWDVKIRALPSNSLSDAVAYVADKLRCNAHTVEKKRKTTKLQTITEHEYRTSLVFIHFAWMLRIRFYVIGCSSTHHQQHPTLLCVPKHQPAVSFCAFLQLVIVDSGIIKSALPSH